MRLLAPYSLLAATASLVSAAQWSFQDGTVSIAAKGAGVGGGIKKSITPESMITEDLLLSAGDTLKILITIVEDKTPKRPHQAFFTLADFHTGLEESWPLSVKENGKARLELTQKDLPHQFLTTPIALVAKFTLASFGSTFPYSSAVFSLRVVKDPVVPLSIPESPLRYGQLPEIHHIFRADPTSPPRIVSSAFALAVAATLPVLVGVWIALGANFAHLGKALNGAPVSHVLFLGSIVAIEGVFFLYYTSWTLFQTLPAVGLLGVVAVVSGSRALTEVQERRLAGER